MERAVYLRVTTTGQSIGMSWLPSKGWIGRSLPIKHHQARTTRHGMTPHDNSRPAIVICGHTVLAVHCRFWTSRLHRRPSRTPTQSANLDSRLDAACGIDDGRPPLAAVNHLDSCRQTACSALRSRFGPEALGCMQVASATWSPHLDSSPRPRAAVPAFNRQV